jgi:hypothetical protein
MKKIAHSRSFEQGSAWPLKTGLLGLGLLLHLKRR